MQDATFEFSKLDSKLLSVGELKKGKGMSAQLMYDGQKCSFQLPKLSCPGGLLTRENEQSNSVTYSLIGSLKGCPPDGKSVCEQSDDIGKMYNSLQAISSAVKKWAFENSSKVFGKKRSEESIADSFDERSIIQLSSDKIGDVWVPNGKYPPSFKAKIPVWDGKLQSDFQVVDQKVKQVPVTVANLAEVFPKGVSVMMLVNGTVYVSNQSFGVTWRIRMIQVFPPNRLEAAKVFKVHEEEEQEEQEVEVPEQKDEEQHVEPSVGGGAPPLQRKRRAALNPA